MYLGFLLTPSAEIHSGLKDLRDRGLKASMKLKHSIRNTFKLEIEVTLFLFDTLVEPILLYLNDFWG